MTFYKQELNEAHAHSMKQNSIFGRGISFSMAAYTGYFPCLGKVAALTAPGFAFWPYFGATLVGLPITYHFWLYVSRGLRELMGLQNWYVRMPVMFVFHAAMSMVSAYIGLAIVGACTSAIGVNPFTLPFFIAIAVAGGIVLAASLAVAARTHYIQPATEIDSETDLRTEIGNTITFFSKRPFNYNKKEGIIVVPFGKTLEQIKANKKPRQTDNNEFEIMPFSMDDLSKKPSPVMLRDNPVQTDLAEKSSDNQDSSSTIGLNN